MNRIPNESIRSFRQAECIDAAHPQRAEVEAFIAGVYRERFDARLSQFMPHILAFRSAHGDLLAAVGLRCGGEGRLFVEHYLDQPVCATLQSTLNTDIRREQLVELGNFAASSPGAARALILALIPLLQDAGMRWVLFVATRQLRNAFHRLGLAPRELAPAPRERLGAEANDWGSYYDEQPRLLYGDLHNVPRQAWAEPPQREAVAASHRLCAVAP